MKMEDGFPETKEYFNAFIRTAQYITHLTSRQDLLAETGNALVRFHGANLVGFFEVQYGEIKGHHWILPDGLFPDSILTDETRKIVREVLANGFLEVRQLDVPGRYAAAFLPITWENQTTAVMLVAHRKPFPFPDDLLNTYLAVAGLVGTAISNAVAAFENIAERKRAEEALKAARENLAFLVSNTPAVLYRCRASGDFLTTFISDNVRQQTGYDAARFMENPGFWKDHLHPDDRNAAFVCLGGVAGGGICSMEYRFFCGDGNYRWIHDEMRLLRDADGNPSELLGYWIDITPRKTAEQELVRKNEELSALNEELTATQEELRQTDDELVRNEQILIGRNDELGALNEELTATEEELRQNVEELSLREQELVQSEANLKEVLAEKEILLSEVHHRVKNNLTAFISLLSLDGSYEDTEGGRVLRKDLQNRARSMALIHETLYRTGKFSSVDMQIYLTTLLSQITDSYAENGKIRIIVDAQGVALDLSRATTAGLIINELVTNSFKYAFPPAFDCIAIRGEPCSIRVSLAREEETHVLTVADNGCGLPAGFDPLTTKSLGLKLVTFLSRHQLRADIGFRSGKGTEFIFRMNHADAHK
jgi:PAS domain S-box-containing protein